MQQPTPHVYMISSFSDLRLPQVDFREFFVSIFPHRGRAAAPEVRNPSRRIFTLFVFLGIPRVVLILVPSSLLCSRAPCFALDHAPFPPKKHVFLKNLRILMR